MFKRMGKRKKMNWKKRAAAFSILLLLFLPGVSTGEEREKGPSEGRVVTLAADQVINEDYFVWGDRIEILGTVRGDVYAAGGDIHIGGTVDGDLLAAGGKVRVSGKVAQDARIAGGEVTLSGTVGRNLTVAGGKVLLTETASIKENVTSAGDLTVSSRIDGVLRAMAGEIRVTSHAVVGGDVRYLSRQNANVEQGARIGGRITRQSPPGMFDFSLGAFAGFLVGMFLLMKVISFISTLILGLLLITLFPRFSREVVANLRRKPLASLGWGFLFTVAIPIVFIGLMITVIGIPLALILFPFYLVSLYLARLVFILWAGILILDRFGAKGHEGWAVLIGMLIYGLLTLVPGPGGLISLLAMMIGLGAALLTVREHRAAA